jgi:4-amino-4-deoxy-L-arabinose transferase
LQEEQLETGANFARHVCFIIAVGLLAVFLFNGRRALYDTSEARYAEVAREMVSTGDWLVPHLLGTPHLTKPPLGYWLTAIPIQLFGTAEWAARLSAGIFFLLTVSLTAELARTLWRSSAAGVLAGWIQLTAIFPLAAAHTVTTDVFLTTLETAGVLAAWKCLRANARYGGWQAAFGAAWGAAFLTKGPPGLLALLAIGIAAVTLRKQLPWRRLVNWRVLVAFVLVAVPWYIIVLRTVPNALETWRTETLTKSFDAPDRQIARYEYLIILLIGSLPGSAALWAAGLKTWRAKRLKSTFGETEWRFLLTWFVFPLVVFMLARQRLYLYVLPLFPPLAVASARVLEQHWRMSAGKFSLKIVPRWARVTAATALILVVTGKVVYAAYSTPGRNFKPLALAIAADARQRNAKPALLIMTRNQGLGLAYYLGEVPMRRTGSKYLQRLRRTKGGKGTQLDRALDTVPTTGTIEYLIIKDKDFRRHQDSMDEHRFGDPIVISPWMALPRLDPPTSSTKS